MQFDRFLREACPPLGLNWRKYRRRAARHRVMRRMADLGIPDFEAYLERLRADSAEEAALANLMRITVSRFFRERDRWKALAQVVIPELLQEKELADPLRFWSAGCCGGEEPNTLALLWLTGFRDRHPDRRVEILGTDIDAASLVRARRGIYGKGSLREVPRSAIERYFKKENRSWHLDSQVKLMVRFESRDLALAPPADGFDLVCCRYLIFTYYQGARLLEAARLLRRALRPGGALMIGRKEALGPAAELFAPWPGAEGVFRKPE